MTRTVPLVLTERRHPPHEGAERPHPHDAASALQDWADRIAARWSDDEDVFVPFNDDPGRDAAADPAHSGTPTRVPVLLNR